MEGVREGKGDESSVTPHSLQVGMGYKGDANFPKGLSVLMAGPHHHGLRVRAHHTHTVPAPPVPSSGVHTQDDLRFFFLFYLK